VGSKCRKSRSSFRVNAIVDPPGEWRTESLLMSKTSPGFISLVWTSGQRPLALELRERQQGASRPIEVVVLNCWVTATKETPLASQADPNAHRDDHRIQIFASFGLRSKLRDWIHPNTPRRCGRPR